MKIVDLLRKLGIFRSGSVSGTYTNATERPTELQMDDVFDAKKDLTTKEDVKNIAGTVAAAAAGDSQPSTLGRKIFFWIMVAVGILFLIGYLSSGFSFRVFIFLILWGGLLFLLKKFAFQGLYAFWMVIVATIIIFFVSLMIFPGSGGDSGNSSTSGKSLAQYDNKVFTLASADGKLNGFATIKVKQNVKQNKPYLQVMYHLKIKDTIAMNTSMGCGGVPGIKGYNYVGMLPTPLSEKKIRPVGAFSQAYCNKDAWPEDLFAFDTKTYQCPKGVTAGTATDTFVPSFQPDFFSFEEFMAANTYELFDGSNAWVKNESGDGCTLEDDIALGQGKKVKAYTFTITERK